MSNSAPNKPLNAKCKDCGHEGYYGDGATADDDPYENGGKAHVCPECSSYWGWVLAIFIAADSE